MKNFVEELRWRGMLQDMMPGTEEQLLKEPTAEYPATENIRRKRLSISFIF